MHATTEERFWAKVDTSGDCWLWTASMDGHGYGAFYDGERVTKAHRYSYELASGPIPKGMLIDHVCHTTACVNPAHLRVADRKQNAENMLGARRDSRTGIRGVCWDTRRRVWLAQVGHKGKQIRVGQYKTIAEAEAAVIAKRLELFTHNDADRLVH